MDMNMEEAIEILNHNYHERVWDHNETARTEEEKMMVPWPGTEEEQIVISAHKDVGIFQKFHRHDFFFVNFAYRGDFKALTREDDQTITIHENDCYMAQPYSGYAITADAGSENTIIAILIKRNGFFNEFFAPLSSSLKLFNFFLHAENDPKSDTAFYIPFETGEPIRPLVELMCIEYAGKDEHTQTILKPLVLAFFLYLMKRCEEIAVDEQAPLPLARQLEQYIRDHCAHISLQALADHFAYHPNYISSYLKKSLGKGFSQIVLEQRMKNAKRILLYSSLSVERTAQMIGYPDPSNFYKAFREYYHMTPKQFVLDQRNRQQKKNR